ncbi:MULTISPECIES: 15-cis-phytoene synthase CrtB [unclassified Pseudomonas]|uniref:15-cis-phytoene synthase CrtB n=1 Tax=unclassified Pseudomonas TaxID=196821 RepID=UPI000BD6C7C1|nr:MULTISPECIES: 15-cis-phytoene synthase CrtB [unclassified Pseudomonas]PVZ20050.1 phytoene synthase [Pseudomonas sp. URIL14HWK12:I12]PVZ27116.1 phytoene synthase [Pseudomonas sp. URIL14HWK12:I10]PVZ38005.1 phytoene synthase [Pseudomonas sp. URIL14HWK12:I11]SNZ04842.1 phytoene synthase [Pseudomonas sp. URIL14HWK12:I9]
MSQAASRPLFEHAQQTIAAGSKSFATAARLFDPATRRDALMLYTWCRHCDDVVDGQVLGFAAPSPASDSPQVRLVQLREYTRRALAGEPMQDPAFAAFQEVALARQIPEEQALAHLDGFAMDVEHRHYEQLDDTLQYCYHVAGVVGLMMARVMGVQDEAVLDRACDLGLAFQLTNIARDIVEDAALGRCYVPAQWLHEAGIDPERIADPANRPALATLATRLVDTAEPYYESAQAGLPALPWRCAWAIATARGVYREIGMKVKQAGPRAWDRRQGTSKLEKLGLLCQGLGQALSARVARQAAPRPPQLWQRPH